MHSSVCPLCVQLQKKKAPKGKSRPPVRSTRVPTFFDFFSPPTVPETESELTEEGMDELQSALEKDYELGYEPGSLLAVF
jgi:nucleosome assembly protein 1-like 1